MRRLILCLLLLLLTRCGELPEPFLGNPGPAGRILAQPPTPRLAVPSPTDALLPDAANRSLANNLATALQAQEVPAVAGPADKYEWRLVTSANLQGSVVVPEFTVLDPQGKSRGQTDGAPVPAAAWSAATPATLQQSAAEAAPKIALLLTNIETARERADPNSLYNRPARVMVADVIGAPGDGDAELTDQMRLRLAALGPVVQTTAVNADFLVEGHVRVVPIGGHKERVEIQWVVKGAKGDERGRVIQLNEIPAGSLNQHWGDVSKEVTAEASGGVNDVLRRQTGHAPGAQSPVDKAAAVRGQGPGAALEGAHSGTGQPAR
ncbi:MAG TPA: hypothetical protein VGG99_04735 [Acetobacteraceae bacterium]|jgi:hypothetical protein